MPREGTKAAEIMRLWKHGIFTTREIADTVGCRPEYVRVVTRQRKGRGTSDIDQRYRSSENGQSKMRRWSVMRRPAMRAYARALYHTGSHEAARDAYGKAIEVVHA